MLSNLDLPAWELNGITLLKNMSASKKKCSLGLTKNTVTVDHFWDSHDSLFPKIPEQTMKHCIIYLCRLVKKTHHMQRCIDVVCKCQMKLCIAI